MAVSPQDKAHILKIVQHYEACLSQIKVFVEQIRIGLSENKALYAQIHSLKWRVKEPSHLKDKLYRKLRDAHAQGKSFDITPDNLFQKINDLGGLRILHLHTRQFEKINKLISEILDELQVPIVEGPVAKTWDDETRQYFKKIGVQSQESDSMYTSVHYIIESNFRTKYTCEIQVRTLAEELWGEVSHVFHYPHPTKSIACGEQIKVLARMTSGCSRLVDSVFRSHEEFQSNQQKLKNPKKPKTAGK